MTLDPASATAVAFCLSARIRVLGTERVPVTAHHPGRCGWCDYTVEELSAMLADFDPEDPAVRNFRSIHPDRRRAMVEAAQAIPEAEPEPEPPAEPAPADAEPTWFDAPEVPA